MLEIVTQSLGTRLKDAGKQRTRLILKPGFYGPVYLSHEWSLHTAVYKLSEVNPRFAVLSAYADLEQELRSMGAWHGGILGVWYLRALDSPFFIERLELFFRQCSARLADFGSCVSHPTHFPEKLDEDELVEIRAAKQAKREARPCPPELKDTRGVVRKALDSVIVDMFGP